MQQLVANAVACTSDGILYTDEKDKLRAKGKEYYGELGNAKVLLPARKIFKIGAGEYHAIGIDENGNGYGWGSNIYGQLGIDRGIKQSNEPVLLDSQCVWMDICGGTRHSLLRCRDKNVYSCGDNTLGQLGRDSTDFDGLKWVQGSVEQMDAGCFHNAMIDDRGVMYTFGWGLYQQLGHDSTDDMKFPAVVNGVCSMEKMKNTIELVQVACGAWHTLLRAKNGDVYSCGWNKHSQLDVEKGAFRGLPTLVQAGGYLDEDGHEAIDIAAGQRSSVIACKNGKVLVLGYMAKDGKMDMYDVDMERFNKVKAKEHQGVIILKT